MEYNRARLKQSVKRSMKGTRPSPMLVTLLFSVLVSVGTGLINALLGRLFAPSGLDEFAEDFLRYLQRGYEVEEALEEVVDEIAMTLFRRGPEMIFMAIIGSFLISVLVFLWQSVMGVGFEGYALSMSRGESPSPGKLFCAFPKFGSVLLTRILTAVFVFLWSLLIFAVYGAVIFAAVMFITELDLLYVAAIVIALASVFLFLALIWVSARYALVDYVLLDKGLSGTDALRESKRLMKGNIAKCFFLELSFFGWYLLQSLIFSAAIGAGIGITAALTASSSSYDMIATAMMAFFALVIVAFIVTALINLWLTPYITGSMAMFYDWTQGKLAVSAPAAGGSGGWSAPSDYAWSSGPSAGPGTETGPSTGLGAGTGSGAGDAAPPSDSQKDDPWK